MSDKKRAPKWLLLIGLPIGFVSSLCGIGGGLFASSFLHFVMGMDLKRATGTGLVLVVATTSAATLSQVLQPEPVIHWGVTGAMILAAMLGSRIGYLVSERVPERALRALFALVLLFSASRMLFSSVGGATPDGAPFEVQGAHYLWAALIGLGGGIVSPILGVGGGLVMVPGLFLGLPGLGFDAARACSLAGGMAGSSRSLVLKRKGGRVSWSHGLLLGAGALLGSSLGVWSLGFHEELLTYGRQGIGLLLAFIGVTFLRAATRKQAAPADS